MTTAFDYEIASRSFANQANLPDRPPAPVISATPFLWRDPSTIPPRPWVYDRWMLRRTVTAVAAPGGVGKSSFMAATALALATGRDLLGKAVIGGPKRVWLWNLEDDGDELARQIQAAAAHHGVDTTSVEDRLFVDSGPDGAVLVTAQSSREGFQILKPVVEALAAELTRRNIDVLIVDPFVSSHACGENDNGAIDAITKEWARLAKRADCSVVLVHHTRKLAGAKVTAEAARGASALVNAARVTLVLNRLDDDEARQFGIADEAEARRIFSVRDDKHNRAPAQSANWFRIASVDLGNGGEGCGDSIGVVTTWTPPDPFDGITTTDLLHVQERVASGDWRENSQASAWVGNAIAEVLGLNAGDTAGKAKIKALLRVWLRNGALRVVRRVDLKTRKPDVPFVEVGVYAIPAPHS